MVKKFIIIISALAMAMPVFAATKAAEVTTAKGRVEIVHGDVVMGKRAKKGAELLVKDIVRTKRRGYAEVDFVDGSTVKVFEKSRMTINGIERTIDGYNAEIQKGKVLFKVEKMADVAGDFRVKTTNSIIGVKGTTFGIVSGGLVTIVEVYNGNVEVLATVSAEDIASGKVDPGSLEGAGKGGDAGENKATLVANLSSGQGAVLSSSGAVQIYEFSGDSGNDSLLFTGVAVGGSDEGDDEGDKGDGGDQGEGDDGDQGDQGDGDQGDGDQGDGDQGDGDQGDGGDQGNQGGGDAEDAMFANLGSGEAGDAGEIGLGGGGDDLPGEGDLGGFGDAPGEGVGDGLGFGDGLDSPDAGDLEGILDAVGDAAEDAGEFYSDPDTRPETDEQINLSTGVVEINISFE
ncbi:MAG: hypothetical protein C0603_10890 [Denitrovibrio sp.]|nr:MAG: hypothetical protein C0603_10890 [Denitrovibrio sp.]